MAVRETVPGIHRLHRVEKYKGFGGLRNEEDVLITGEGHRVLGRRKPLTIEEVESA